MICNRLVVPVLASVCDDLPEGAEWDEMLAASRVALQKVGRPEHRLCDEDLGRWMHAMYLDYACETYVRDGWAH